MNNYVPTEHIVGMITRLFRFHPAHGDQAERYASIREGFEGLAMLIVKNTPPGPEQTLAIRELYMAQMLAISSIAVNEDE